MKRCPECRRDYMDDSMLYCLDDGRALLEGPASNRSVSDEPRTAILHETSAPAEAETRAQIHTTERTAVFPGAADHDLKGKSFDQRLLLAPVVLAVIVLGGFFGHRYFNSSISGQINSIAVMPFVNDSGNADVEYLSDGMTETLIRSLSNLESLDVKPRSAVFRYKGKDSDIAVIARELNVEGVLNGRVVQRGEQVTLNLELVDALRNRVVWSEQYIRKTSDLVTLQSDIAKDVSAKLKSKLTGADEAKVAKIATTDPEAYQAYLKGRYYWNRRTSENLKKAIEQFKIAADRDPNYALAYSGLADCYVLGNFFTGAPVAESRAQAKAYAERAIAIDDQLGEPRAALALLYSQSWQWAEAEREFNLAIELNPNYATAYHWFSILLRARGRIDEAADMIKQAHEIDPLSSIISVNMSEIYHLQKDHNASIENSLKIIELDPTFAAAYETLGLSYLKQGRNTEAIANLEKAVELSKREAYALAALGYGYAVTGKRPEAVAIVKELEERYARKDWTVRNIAAVYSGLGDKDKAFEWLEKGFQDKGDLSWISFEIPFESLRDDPRYKDLLKRMNLAE